MRLPIFVAAVLALCVTPSLAEKVNLAGQVTYRERIALPDTATLRLQLIDQTLAFAPPRLDVEAPTGHGQVPLGFNLTFDDSLIIPNHSYALEATIGTPEGVMFRTPQPYALDPLAPSEPIVIVTSPARLASAEATPTPVPVEPTEPTALALLDITWKAATIGEDPILPRTKPTLQVGSDMRAGGESGCNSWFAEVQVDSSAIRFGNVTSTERGCGQSVSLQEKAYYDVLAAAASWTVYEDTLTLYGPSGKPVATFTR